MSINNISRMTITHNLTSFNYLLFVPGIQLFIICARYPDDVYDRKWPMGMEYYFSDQVEISTNLTVNSSNPFQLPEVIARTAGRSKNGSESPFLFYASGDNPSDNIVVYLHFAEIQDLRPNDIREFDVVWNKNITISAYSPKRLEIETIFNTSPNKCDGCNMELVRTRKSTLPPLLNAYEVYNVMEFPYSETYPADGMSISFF